MRIMHFNQIHSTPLGEVTALLKHVVNDTAIKGCFTAQKGYRNKRGERGEKRAREEGFEIMRSQ